MHSLLSPEQSLIKIYQSPEIQKNAREINEIHGFICAVAALPEALELQDWFPCLWMPGCEPLFSSEALAIDFASAVLPVYENVLLKYQQREPLILSSQLWLDEDLQITKQGRAFASGYLSGFQYFEECWQNLNLSDGSETQQLLQTTLLLLTKMATPNSNDPQMQALFIELPTIQEIVSSLPQLLAALGHSLIAVANNE